MLEPLGKLVLVEPAKAAEMTEGGLHLPGIAQDPPRKGEVIDVGSEVTMAIQAGDVVLYGKYSGEEVEYGKGTYLLIHQDDLLAIDRP